jgi:hypothetical protein
MPMAVKLMLMHVPLQILSSTVMQSHKTGRVQTSDRVLHTCCISLLAVGPRAPTTTLSRNCANERVFPPLYTTTAGGNCLSRPVNRNFAPGGGGGCCGAPVHGTVLHPASGNSTALYCTELCSRSRCKLPGAGKCFTDAGHTARALDSQTPVPAATIAARAGTQ